MRGPYTDELIERLTGAIDEASRREYLNGGAINAPKPGPLAEELAKVNLRLVDTTRERAMVDERIYTNALKDRDHWRGLYLVAERFIDQFVAPPRAMEEGDLGC